MTEQTSQSPDENGQPAGLRDRARHLAPYAAGAAGAVALVVATVLISGRVRRAPVQLRQMAPQTSSVEPGVLLAGNHVSPSDPVCRSTHVVRSHVRGNVPINGYVRPRVRRGHESLTASQVAELLERA